MGMDLNLPKEEQQILEKLATNKNQTVNQYISELIKEKQGPPATYQEHGTTLEKVTLDLPRSIINFYRFKTQAHGLDHELAPSLIAIDVIDRVHSMLQGSQIEDWTEFFNLKSAFESAALRENLIEKLETA